MQILDNFCLSVMEFLKILLWIIKNKNKPWSKPKISQEIEYFLHIYKPYCFTWAILIQNSCNWNERLKDTRIYFALIWFFLVRFKRLLCLHHRFSLKVKVYSETVCVCTTDLQLFPVRLKYTQHPSKGNIPTKFHKN